MTFMATDQKASPDSLAYPWKDADPRSKVMFVVGMLAILCLLLALIVPDSNGSPGHLLSVRRPAPVPESVRIDAGGPHELPTGWAISYGIFGVSQTPGEVEVWVDGQRLAMLKWTDYQAHRKAFCVSPVGERVPYFLATVVPGSTVTVVPKDLSGDWYVDFEMFPTYDECG